MRTADAPAPAGGGPMTGTPQTQARFRTVFPRRLFLHGATWVLARSNTAAEIEEKRRLYFEAGAVEVWTCDLEGHIRFYDESGKRSRSGVVPSFPTRIEV